MGKYQIGDYLWSKNYKEVYQIIAQDVNADKFELVNWNKSRKTLATRENIETNGIKIDWQNLPVWTKIRTHNNFRTVTDGEHIITKVMYGVYILDNNSFLGIFQSVLPDPNCEIINYPEQLLETPTMGSVLREMEARYKKDSSCEHKNKYLNIVSSSLQFWFCPSCRKEVK